MTTTGDPKKKVAVPVGGTALKQPPDLGLISDAEVTRILTVTYEELDGLALPFHLLLGQKRYVRTVVEEFKLKSYWPAGKPHADGARKRKADPSAAGKLQGAKQYTHSQAAGVLTVTDEVLEAIRANGGVGHLDLGNRVYRYVMVDLKSLLRRSLQTPLVKRSVPVIDTPPVPVPAPPSPESRPAPLQQRPPAVAVRKIQRNSAMAKPPAVTTVDTPTVPVQGTSTLSVVPAVFKYDPRLSVDMASAPAYVADEHAFSSALGALHDLLGLADDPD